MKVENITELPKACRLGNLIQYKNFVYYVGGITENQENEDGIIEFIGSPIMRYNILENSWEVFMHKEKNDLEENVSESQKSKTEYKTFSLRDLIYPGTFLLHSKIYFYAGSIIKPELSYNLLVYSIDLESEHLNLEIEPFFFPIALNNPQSSANSSFGFIYGEINPDSQANFSSFTFNIKHDFKLIKSQHHEIQENYPPICTDKYIIVMSFPKFSLKLKNSEGWLTYGVSTKNYKSSILLIESAVNTIKHSIKTERSSKSISSLRFERPYASYSNSMLIPSMVNSLMTESKRNKCNYLYSNTKAT